MTSLQLVSGNTVTVNSPSRALNATFQPSHNRPVVVFYVIKITCTVSVGGSSTGAVDLLCDPSNPSTTRARAALTHSLAVGVGVGSTVEQIVTIAWMVPPGHRVQLASSGDASIEIVNQTEVVL